MRCRDIKKLGDSKYALFALRLMQATRENLYKKANASLPSNLNPSNHLSSEGKAVFAFVETNHEPK